MSSAEHAHTTTRRTLLAQVGAASVIGITGAAAATSLISLHDAEEPLVALERRFIETGAVFDAAWDAANERYDQAEGAMSFQQMEDLCAAERTAHWAVWSEMARTPPVGPAGAAVLARQWLHCVTGEGGDHHQEAFARALLTWSTQQAILATQKAGGLA